MKDLIAIATSDWHLNEWKQFNKDDVRSSVSDGFVEELCKQSHTLKVPILFSGDLFHTPGGLTNSIIDHHNALFRMLEDKYPGARIIGISGNHDMAETSIVGKEKKTYMKSFSKAFPKLFTCIDETYLRLPMFTVYGIPYLTHNRGFTDIVEDLKTLTEKTNNDPKILLIHTHLYGAKDPSGYEVDEVPNIPRNLGKLFKGFDLVLAGHIHKHAKLWKEKVLMVGAPYQQRASDSGTKMGYLDIYSDMTFKFRKYKAPEFIYYNEGERPDDDYNYLIEVPKPTKKRKELENTFKGNASKESLAKEYFKTKNIKNKRRLNLLIDVLNKAEE